MEKATVVCVCGCGQQTQTTVCLKVDGGGTRGYLTCGMPGVLHVCDATRELHVCDVTRECVVAKGFPFAQGIYQNVKRFRMPLACVCVRVFV